MAFAIESKAKGDEDKVFTSLRRLQEEDPTIDLHRDQQTGDQIVAGLSQVHVEVIVDRLKERFGAEVTLKPPRVPYQETIRKPAKAHGRHKKQTGGRGQFGDCHIEIEPLAEGTGFEFVNAIKGGVIPHSFIPAVEKGCLEAMAHGAVAGYPVKGVRVRLHDGSYHTVDSSEMAFKLAGSMAMRQALEQAGPVLLEPIMLVTLSVPEDAVGDVIGDLNSRRGRPPGMEPGPAGMTEVKAEVPMAEMLTYAPDLRSLTGGQGDYTMEFLRYEEVPGHLAQKVVDEAREESRRCAPERRPRPDGRAAGGALAGTLGRHVTRKSISTSKPVVNCDVCGRTLLRGETPDVFLAAGSKKNVCELCTQRASHEGWIREGLDGATVRATEHNGRSRSLLSRLRPRHTAREHDDERPRRRAARQPPRPPPGRPGARAPAAARAALGPRHPDQRRPEDGPRAGPVQRQRASAHRGRRVALARPADRRRAPVAHGGQRGDDRRRLGAELVPLRGRPRRRGRRRAAGRAGRRAQRARAGRPDRQRGRRRPRRLARGRPAGIVLAPVNPSVLTPERQ